jgi:hypothetical protein
VCRPRAEIIGKAGIYAEYFTTQARWLLKQGRRPCLWGDMLLTHPEILKELPRQTVIFDWQYFQSPADSTRRFREAGFDVVCCPSIQSYNSAWCFLDATLQNIDRHLEVATKSGALGVLITTWEFSYFSSFESILPLIRLAGNRVAQSRSWDQILSESVEPSQRRAMEILGRNIPESSGFLAPGTWRRLRDAFVIRQNPFALWREWPEAAGPLGDQILALCQQVETLVGVSSPWSLPTRLYRTAVEFVRHAQLAALDYRDARTDAAIEHLRDADAALASLRPTIERISSSGGSQADPARLTRLQQKVQMVIERVRSLDRVTAARPSFAALVYDQWIAGDQAAWACGEPAAAHTSSAS